MPIARCQIHETCSIPQPNLVNLYDCTIGERTKVAAHVEIGKDVVIGKNCLIQAHAFIPSGVVIGDEVFVGPGVVFCNDKHPPRREAFTPETVTVEDGVSIGANATILPGITLRKGCMIAAGAVVTHDVEECSLVMGNPARPVDYAR